MPRDPLRGSAWSRCKPQVVFAFLRCADEPSAGIGVVDVQKLKVFAISDLPARPSAGIGVVEVQKLELFLRFCGARMNDRRGRGTKARFVFAISDLPARPSTSFCTSRFFAFLRADEPSAGIVCVDALSLWRRANSF